MSPRRSPAAAKKLSANASPEERARDAIAREESIPGDKVRMTFRVVLARRDAEALTARAIREERNVVDVVTEILETAAQAGGRMIAKAGR
jgi:hypothetical protein